MSNQPAKGINQAELLHSISHELRSPLSNIFTFAEMILAKAENLADNQIQQDAQRIQTSVQRLLSVTDNILELIRVEGLTLQCAKLDISVPINEALERVHEAASATKLILTSNIPSDAPALEIDAVSIAQVVCILLMHAIKFAEQDTVGINVYCDDTSITVCVGDGDIRTKPEANHEIDLPANRIKGALQRLSPRLNPSKS